MEKINFVEAVDTKKIIVAEIVDDIVKDKFEKICKMTCVPEYYKNQFLAYAMRHNNSVPCINRCYAEMLQTYSQNFSHDSSDLTHSNQYIPYLGTYCNEEMLKFISDLCYELREHISYAFQNKLALISFYGRLKGVRSFEAKTRAHILKNKTFDFVQKNFETYLRYYQKSLLKKNPKDKKGKFAFTDDAFKYAHKYLEVTQKTLLKSITSKDSIGYRIIVNNYNHSRDETVLTQTVYIIFNLCKDFFESRGYEIIKYKDYIENPKGNQYQSLHFVVVINGIPVEFQIRTAGMHQVAEEGTASYHDVYKDTILQKFLQNYMYNISKELNYVSTHQDIGFLEHIPLPKQTISITPLSEIPKTPADLKSFPDLVLLEKIYAESPKIIKI